MSLVRNLTLSSLVNTLNFGDGHVFYVDPTSGTAGASGESPYAALSTRQAAINKCVDGRGDVIVCLPGTENPTTAILFNKSGITMLPAVFGADPTQGSEEGFSIYPADTYTTGPMAIITKPCTIIGMEFVSRAVLAISGRTVATCGAALAFDGDAGGTGGGFSLIKNCRFVDWWGGYAGIALFGGGYNLIEGCAFEGYDAGVAVYSGVHGPESNHVIDCHFQDCTYGIEHILGGSAPHHFLYKGNTFIDSKGVHFNNSASDGLVCNNFFETATDTAAYDIAVAAAQVLGANFSGNHYSE